MAAEGGSTDAGVQASVESLVAQLQDEITDEPTPQPGLKCTGLTFVNTDSQTLYNSVVKKIFSSKAAATNFLKDTAGEFHIKIKGQRTDSLKVVLQSLLYHDENGTTEIHGTPSNWWHSRDFQKWTHRFVSSSLTLHCKKR